VERVSAVTLRAGAIDVGGYRVVRTGLRWFWPDGQQVRAGEPIAYCNIGLVPLDRQLGREAPFAEEGYDLQVAFASRVSGRLRHSDVSPGGFLDRLTSFAWDGDLVLGRIEDASGEPDGPAGEPRLLMLAARRFNELSGDRSGLHAGWHDRSRAWWGEGEAPHATLIGLGNCEQNAVLRGEAGQYRELFAATAGPTQVIVAQEEPLVPCARTLVEQLRFTDADRMAIRRDMAESFLAGPVVPSAQEWVFMGALINALVRSPLEEPADILTRTGVHRAAPPAALSLSLTAELPRAGRHRRLGYTLNAHGFRLATVGPAVRHWIRTAFEPITRTVDAVRADYAALRDELAGRGRPALIVFNSISTQAYEDIADYRALDAGTFAALGTVRAKSLNLMLHDLARESGRFHIVDADGIAAELGMRAHLPDGVHPSGPMQAELRAELLRVVRAAGVAGFALRAD
jgi:hypothetical protein